MRNQTDFPSLADELTPQPDTEGGDLLTNALDLLSTIWARRGFVLKAAVAGGILAIALALLLPKKYSSTTRLMPPDKSHGSLAAVAKVLGDQNVSSLAADAMGIQMPGEVLIQVLRSRTVEDELIQKFDLRRIYRKKLWKDARKELERNTDISEDRKSGVITLGVTARSPQLAADLARSYVQSLNDLMSQLDASSAHRERLFIEERLKEVKTDLDRQSLLLSQFSSENATLDPKEQGKSMVEAAARLQGELIAAEAELRGLREIYGPENSRVRAAEGKISELSHALKGLQGSSGDEDMGYPSIRKLPVVGLEYSDLYRNVRIQESVYESLTKQYEMAKVEEARDIPSVRVLDEAEIPEVKSSPKRTLIVLVGILLSIGLAATWVVVANLWRNASEEAPLKKFAIRLHEDLLHDALRLPWLREWVLARSSGIHEVEGAPQEEPVEALTGRADAKRASS